MEILSSRPLIAAYEDGKTERERVLDEAAKAIDFGSLEKGDQKAFDASLRLSQSKLEALRPWMRQFTIRAVGNAHIDMAWLWPWTETVEVVRNTFRSVLDLMREYPDFKFTMSSARTYEWMEEKYPDMFQEIQQRVKEGPMGDRRRHVGRAGFEHARRRIAGPADPGGERVLSAEVSAWIVKIGWNPDSFGYNWQLPQIYKKSGMDYFVTQKLLWAHEFTTFPYKLFWWQSPDGSRMLTYFPHDYAAGIEAARMAKISRSGHPQFTAPIPTTIRTMMHLYGIGDHGGGPTRAMLDNVPQLTAPNDGLSQGSSTARRATSSTTLSRSLLDESSHLER